MCDFAVEFVHHGQQVIAFVAGSFRLVLLLGELGCDASQLSVGLMILDKDRVTDTPSTLLETLLFMSSVHFLSSTCRTVQKSRDPLLFILFTVKTAIEASYLFFLGDIQQALHTRHPTRILKDT